MPDNIIKWRTLMDLHVLTAGDNLEHQYATAWDSGCWCVWNRVDERIASGTEESVEAAKAVASLAVFDHGLISIQHNKTEDEQK